MSPRRRRGSSLGLAPARDAASRVQPDGMWPTEGDCGEEAGQKEAIGAAAEKKEGGGADWVIQ